MSKRTWAKGVAYQVQGIGSGRSVFGTREADDEIDLSDNQNSEA